MNKFFLIDDTKITLSGQTYDERDFIKSIKGKWNSEKKFWWVPFSAESLDLLISRGFIQATQKSENSLKNVQIPGAKSLTPEPEKTLTVTQVIETTSFIIKNHFSASIYVHGEVTSLKNSNGHVFFELSETEQDHKDHLKQRRLKSIGCVIWADVKKKLDEKNSDFNLQDGLHVRLSVFVEFSSLGAKIQLIVQDIDMLFTMGQLALTKQNILKILRERGLIRKNKELAWPKFPLRIALITAHQSMAFSDFFDELLASNIDFQITVFDSNMQGESVESNVCEAFTEINLKYVSKFDVVVLTRGGGSRLDLRWFDSLEIAKQIAYCKIPVITAIGHQDDNSIADEVAFHNLKTPTAAAGILIQSVVNQADLLRSRLVSIGENQLKNIETKKMLLALQEKRIAELVQLRFAKENSKLSELLRLLNILKRNLGTQVNAGSVTLRSPNGEIINYAKVNEFFEAQNSNEMIAVVTFINPNNNKKHSHPVKIGREI